MRTVTQTPRNLQDAGVSKLPMPPSELQSKLLVSPLNQINPYSTPLYHPPPLIQAHGISVQQKTIRSDLRKGTLFYSNRLQQFTYDILERSAYYSCVLKKRRWLFPPPWGGNSGPAAHGNESRQFCGGPSLSV